jgi:hypothetical protein
MSSSGTKSASLLPPVIFQVVIAVTQPSLIHSIPQAPAEAWLETTNAFDIKIIERRE